MSRLSNVYKFFLHEVNLIRYDCFFGKKIMDHTWFLDVSWDLLEKKDKSMAIPYDIQVDYNAARIRIPDQIGSLSSAESIDPEDNAKYFADF